MGATTAPEGGENVEPECVENALLLVRWRRGPLSQSGWNIGTNGAHIRWMGDEDGWGTDRNGRM